MSPSVTFHKVTRPPATDEFSPVSVRTHIKESIGPMHYRERGCRDAGMRGTRHVANAENCLITR